MYKIPFNKPSLVGNEIQYLEKTLANSHLSGDGQFTHSCHQYIENVLGVKKALLTTSCTHALEMAAILFGLLPGDEVIVPSYTFVSTVNAFVLHGAIPKFVDIRSDTLNMYEKLIEQLISTRTKAIVPVHYAGVGCEMDTIMGIANKYGTSVIEDNAHGLFGKYKGQFLGTFGSLATQSFHETKNFMCGEGGALLINDLKFVERAEIIREKGTNRSRFFRGQVDKYSWVDIGSSYLPSDLLAAFLFAQFEKRQEIQNRRKEIWEFYSTHLQTWASESGVGLPVVPSHCEQAYHMFYLLMPSFDYRQALIDHLKLKGIQSVFHYLPLHISDMGRRYGGKLGDCPVTESVSDHLLRLPFYISISESEQAYVIDNILDFRIA